MAKAKDIFDLEGLMAIAGAVITPNPYTITNLASHLTTGQSVGANLPGAAGATVRGAEGAIRQTIGNITDNIGDILPDGGGKTKPFVPSRPDFGGPRAHAVGSEQQRRAEAKKMKRNVAYSRGGVVSYKSISDLEKKNGRY